MATYTLMQFPFNTVLQEALKERFSAKWSPTASAWTVGSKVKALAAEALIKEVLSFEKERILETTRIERHHILSDRHPEAAIYAPHPLTGAMWVGRIPKELRAELDEIRTQLAADETRRLAEEAAQDAAASAAEEAAQAAQIAQVAPELARAAAIVAKAAIVKAEATALIDDISGGVINYAAIHAAQKKMESAARKVGSGAKAEYRAAQKELGEIKDALKAAGLFSEGISMLINMNFNRPDRDKPLSVMRSQVYALTKITDKADVE